MGDVLLPVRGWLSPIVHSSDYVRHFLGYIFLVSFSWCHFPGVTLLLGLAAFFGWEYI